MSMDIAATASARDLSKAPGAPRFALLGRVAAALWFLLLAAICGRSLGLALHRAFGDIHSPLAWTPVVASICSGAFYVILGWLMVARPAPRATHNSAVQTIVAMAGTYGVWLMPFLPHAPADPLRSIAGASLTLIGSGLILVSINWLGRSFSISPQARALVTTGPYRIVRNPLYMAEEIAVVGALLQFQWWAAAGFFIVHAGLQIRRILYEEAILRRAIPEYAAYAARTARLIPGVW
ncbi:MAG TPA: isoprenylcysteine carboxylmethyltransferase family protein [Caulobacteraceae bacterium]|jgi:protein-S-isoprenylcysteine O-methyltransferase Ste14|nr:isoprenylcysteine carboxylmethyltransferase family protein [Caulobacteraceae bacterium]